MNRFEPESDRFEPEQAGRFEPARTRGGECYRADFPPLGHYILLTDSTGMKKPIDGDGTVRVGVYSRDGHAICVKQFPPEFWEEGKRFTDQVVALLAMSHEKLLAELMKPDSETTQLIRSMIGLPRYH